MATNSLTSLCGDTTEAVPLNVQRSLYLKPIAKAHISVQLPQMKSGGKSISNWEVMERLKSMAKPEKFIVLKVIKSALEFIRLEAEIETKSSLPKLLAKLDGTTMKLSGYPEQLKIRAVEAKLTFPSRHDWDSYFRDAKHMNEMKPGERPDTLHISDIPSKWFTEKDSSSSKPSEWAVLDVFNVYGDIRCLDIPLLDPYRGEIAVTTSATVGNIPSFKYGQDLQFDVYLQFKEYMCFVKCMEALRGMKLMHKGPDGKAYTANIRVDFDKTKHLSEKSIRKRMQEREKIKQLLAEKEEHKRREKEEEEKRHRELEEKAMAEERNRQRRHTERKQRNLERQLDRECRRKQKILDRKKQEEEKRIAENIAKEERKLLIARRKLESIRLLSELLDRVKRQKTEEDVHQQEENLVAEQKRLAEEAARKVEETKRRRLQEKKRRHDELQVKEKELREKILKGLHDKEEREREAERESLRKRISGQVRLKSAVVVNNWLDKR